MKKRILILEDLPSSRKALVNMVAECGSDLVIFDFGDPANALQCAMDNKIDLFLIDIVLKPQQPNDFSGIAFARSIRESSKYTTAEIVFITTPAGLEANLLRTVHCFDYIEKPISKKRVQKVVSEALNKIEGRPSEDELIFLRKDRVTYPVYAKKIVYFESTRKTLYVHTTDDLVDIPNLSLKKVVDKIQTQEFIFSSKGVAINADYIEYVDLTNRYIKMRGVDQMLNIGERMKEQFWTQLMKYGEVDKK